MKNTRMILLCGAAIAAGTASFGIWSRHSADAAVARVTEDAALPVVAAVVAQPGPAEEEVILPGTVQAAIDTPIYARTSGYIKRWYTDIGAHVKAGDLLAEIDTPELNQQLRQARADLQTAEANNRVAQATAKRVRALLPTQSVSAEQDDQASNDASAKAALVASNEANVKRLEELVAFERVVAPYDGIVTARETDVGNLINAGSGAGAELFRVADTRKLRIYVQVPQSYATRVKPGVGVALSFPEFPGRSFEAKLVRTLLAELEADNAKGELLSGGYVDVRFTLPVSTRGVRVSPNALLFRAEGPRIASVDAEGRTTLHEVTLGRDFGTSVEVLTGVTPGEKVILNPPASLQSGALVKVKADEKG